MNNYLTEILAPSVWGPHPMGWPVPPRSRPHWWQFAAKRNLDKLEYVFGRLSNNQLRTFWTESAKGQSVYEDAGGYMIRCYAAMIGEPVEPPYTYAQAASDLLATVRT